MSQLWEDRYGAPEYAYGTAPNAFFQQYIDDKKPGSILFPGEGEGRNAVYAAQLGWNVTAFDLSTKGKEKAQLLAQEQGVSFDYQIAGVQDYAYPQATFDAIVVCYLHLPKDLRTLFHNKIVTSLKPEGELVLEMFAQEQLPLNSGGPKRLDMLYSVELLRSDFAPLEFKLLQQEQVVLDEGPFHKGEAEVVRMIAKRVD